MTIRSTDTVCLEVRDLQGNQLGELKVSQTPHNLNFRANAYMAKHEAKSAKEYMFYVYNATTHRLAKYVVRHPNFPKLELEIPLSPHASYYVDNGEISLHQAFLTEKM